MPVYVINNKIFTVNYDSFMFTKDPQCPIKGLATYYIDNREVSEEEFNLEYEKEKSNA
jgi:hypothetical protein